MQDEHPNLAKGIRAVRQGRLEPARRLLQEVVVAEPSNETAWVWLARAQQGNPEQATTLQQILALNPKNNWANEQFATLQTSSRPQATRAKQAKQNKPTNKSAATPHIQALSCPKCGAKLEVRSLQTCAIACSYCGSLIDLAQEHPALIGRLNHTIKPLQPIEVGMECKLKDKNYQVIGWIQYKGSDHPDDHPGGYQADSDDSDDDDDDSETIWYWDEWLLMAANGQVRWVSYDPEEGFIWQQKIAPIASFDPKTCTRLPTAEGNLSVKERAQAQVHAVMGELTWLVRPEDKIDYLEATGSKARYSVEAIANQEIEMFQGHSLPEEEVWQAFGRNDLVTQLRQKKDFTKIYFWLACLSALLFLICVVAWLMTNGGGRPLYQGDFLLQRGAATGQIVGPIAINNTTQPLKVSLRGGPLPTNNWAIVEVSLINAAGTELFVYAAEFWDESGSDDEGTWRENSLTASNRFKLAASGVYSMAVSLDETSMPTTTLLIQSYPVSVTLQEGVWVAEYLLVGCAIFALAAGYFWILSQNRTLSDVLNNLAQNND